jgi:ribonuclease III
MTLAASVDPCELEKRLGYRFRDKDLLQHALTHKSFAYESGGSPHNESMEFLGDSILGFLVTDFIFHEFPEFSEGRKSKIKAYLVSSTTLSMLALQLDIPQYLRLGRGEEKTGGRKKKALSANAFEAVIAAIYLDSGIEEVRRFLAPIYHPLIREVGEGRAAVEDPKTAPGYQRNLSGAIQSGRGDWPRAPEDVHVGSRGRARRQRGRSDGRRTSPAAQTALARLPVKRTQPTRPAHREEGFNAKNDAKKNQEKRR